MNAQQIIGITTFEEHEKGCFSLVLENEVSEIVIWVDNDGQIDKEDYECVVNGLPVVLSSEVLNELETYLNKKGLLIEENRLNKIA